MTEFRSTTIDSANQLANENATTVPTKAMRIKVRQHVNPLSEKFQIPLALPPNWLSEPGVVFARPKQRLYLDIGCAKGSWAISMAKEKPDFNFLGLEIRRPCVELALWRRSAAGLGNAHFFASNANVDIAQILRDVSSSGVEVEQVSIQFPDPLFKTKHKKRRVVTDELVSALRAGTPPGTKIFLQSDVLEVTWEMMESFLRNDGFRPAEGYLMSRPEELCLNPSTSPVKTEREVATENKGLPVHRMLLLRAPGISA